MNKSKQQHAARWLTGLSFIGIGVAHFVKPRTFMQIMPPYLPLHRELVLLSGAFEVLGGVAVFFPRLRRFARWMLTLNTIAVYPANIHMALNAKDYEELVPAWALWARLPLQFLIIAGVFNATQPPEASNT